MSENIARTRLDPVDPSLLKGLREHVHDALRRAIISGEIPSGALLNERQMAEQLGVSTTPLKEALRRLENEGLIVTEPRRGTRVTFDAAQAEEMALARAALESMIARMAATRIDGRRDRDAAQCRRRDGVGDQDRRSCPAHRAERGVPRWHPCRVRLPLSAAHPGGAARL